MISATGLVVGLLAALPVGAQDAEVGEQIYVAACSGCHKADGTGIAGTFPPLVDNPRALDAEYVSDVVRNGLSGPITVDGVAYDATMPAFAQLSDDEVAGIVAYLATNFQGTSTGGGTTATTIATGGGTTATTIATDFDAPAGSDNERGEDLFLGSTRFTNGGAACAACHTAGGRGNLGGSSLGPDLTNVLGSYGGPDGLVGVLAAPAFPVMGEAYADKPLTEQERLDLAAFFVTASQEDDADSGDALLVLGLVGAGALFGGMVLMRPFAGAGYSRRLRRNA